MQNSLDTDNNRGHQMQLMQKAQLASAVTFTTLGCNTYAMLSSKLTTVQQAGLTSK